MPLSLRTCCCLSLTWLLCWMWQLASANPALAQTDVPSRGVMEVGSTRPQSDQLQQRTPPAATEPDLPLPARRPPSEKSSGARATSPAKTSIATMLGSLGIVVGLFLLVIWFARRAAPQSAAPLPSEVVTVLGRTALAQRNMLQLVRVGSKLILVSVSSQGATTLTEITDPAEVDRLSAACERQRPASITASFRQVLGHFAEESHPRGFIGSEAADETTRTPQVASD